MKAGYVVMVIVGTLLALCGIGLLAGGVAAATVAAGQGFAPAQGNLGFALSDDIMHSEMWAILGAEQKDEMSQSLLTINESLMSAEQVAKAKEMAAACKSSNYKTCD